MFHRIRERAMNMDTSLIAGNKEMGRILTSHQCDLCDEGWSHFITIGLFVYRLPDSRYAWIDRDFRWCNGCESFSAVERLPSESELQADLIKAQDELTQIRKKKADFGTIRLYKKSVQEQKASIDWKKVRKSPPRCLFCGSSDVFENEITKHPECGGEIKRNTDIPLTVSKRHVYRIYDVEGCFLKKEEKLKRTFLPWRVLSSLFKRKSGYFQIGLKEGAQ